MCPRRDKLPTRVTSTTPAAATLRSQQPKVEEHPPGTIHQPTPGKLYHDIKPFAIIDSHVAPPGVVPLDNPVSIAAGNIPTNHQSRVHGRNSPVDLVASASANTVNLIVSENNRDLYRHSAGRGSTRVVPPDGRHVAQWPSSSSSASRSRSPQADAANSHHLNLVASNSYHRSSLTPSPELVAVLPNSLQIPVPTHSHSRSSSIASGSSPGQLFAIPPHQVIPSGHQNFSLASQVQQQLPAPPAASAHRHSLSPSPAHSLSPSPAHSLSASPEITAVVSPQNIEGASQLLVPVSSEVVSSHSPHSRPVILARSTLSRGHQIPEVSTGSTPGRVLLSPENNVPFASAPRASDHSSAGLPPESFSQVKAEHSTMVSHLLDASQSTTLQAQSSASLRNPLVQSNPELADVVPRGREEDFKMPDILLSPERVDDDADMRDVGVPGGKHLPLQGAAVHAGAPHTPQAPTSTLITAYDMTSRGPGASASTQAQHTTSQTRPIVPGKSSVLSPLVDAGSSQFVQHNLVAALQAIAAHSQSNLAPSVSQSSAISQISSKPRLQNSPQPIPRQTSSIPPGVGSISSLQQHVNDPSAIYSRASMPISQSTALPQSRVTHTHSNSRSHVVDPRILSSQVQVMPQRVSPTARMQQLQSSAQHHVSSMMSQDPSFFTSDAEMFEFVKRNFGHLVQQEGVGAAAPIPPSGAAVTLPPGLTALPPGSGTLNRMLSPEGGGGGAASAHTQSASGIPSGLHSANPNPAHLSYSGARGASHFAHVGSASASSYRSSVQTQLSQGAHVSKVPIPSAAPRSAAPPHHSHLLPQVPAPVPYSHSLHHSGAVSIPSLSSQSRTSGAAPPAPPHSSTAAARSSATTQSEAFADPTLSQDLVDQLSSPGSLVAQLSQRRSNPPHPGSLPPNLDPGGGLFHPGATQAQQQQGGVPTLPASSYDLSPGSPLASEISSPLNFSASPRSDRASSIPSHDHVLLNSLDSVSMHGVSAAEPHSNAMASIPSNDALLSSLDSVNMQGFAVAEPNLDSVDVQDPQGRSRASTIDFATPSIGKIPTPNSSNDIFNEDF